MTERDLVPVGATFGSRRPVQGSDFEDNKTLTHHAYLPVFDKRATKTRWLHWGYGVNNADADPGRHGCDLQVADDDAGTNQADAKGRARFAVYPDEEMDVPKATGDVFTLSELRDFENVNARERELFPAMKPGAKTDEVIVFEVEIDESQAGKVVYAEGSAASFHYTEVKQS